MVSQVGWDSGYDRMTRMRIAVAVDKNGRQHAEACAAMDPYGLLP